MFTINEKTIALTPFPKEARALEVVNGIAKTARHKIVELSVVFNALGYPFPPTPVGSKVWLRASDSEAPWAKEVFTVENKEFIIVPVDRIVLADKSPSETACVPARG